MRINYRILAALLAGAFVCGTVQANAVTNGGFEDAPDWTGWTGEQGDFLFGTTMSGNPSTLSGFSLVEDVPGNQHAMLTTDSSNGIWDVALFQEVTIPNSTEPVFLSFDYLWAPTDVFSDLMSIQLDGLAILNELDAVADEWTRFIYDVSSFKGETVELLFQTNDIDSVSDTLKIDNVSIPEPGLLWLLGMGLFGLGASRRRLSQE